MPGKDGFVCSRNKVSVARHNVAFHCPFARRHALFVFGRKIPFRLFSGQWHGYTSGQNVTSTDVAVASGTGRLRRRHLTIHSSGTKPRRGFVRLTQVLDASTVCFIYRRNPVSFAHHAVALHRFVAHLHALFCSSARFRFVCFLANGMAILPGGTSLQRMSRLLPALAACVAGI